MFRVIIISDNSSYCYMLDKRPHMPIVSNNYLFLLLVTAIESKLQFLIATITLQNVSYKTCDNKTQLFCMK